MPMSLIKKKQKNKIWSLATFLFLLVALGITILAVRQIQTLQSRAADNAHFVNGKYYCSGCSNNYDRTFGRWESSTSNCADVIEGTQLYTPSCDCRAPGRSPYQNTQAYACSGPTYTCSGCSSPVKGNFVEWLSIYPNCPPGTGAGKNVVQTKEDAHCSAFAGLRDTITPTPVPDSAPDSCTLSVSGNPCYTTSYFRSPFCGATVSWTSNRPIDLYFQNATILALNPVQFTNIGGSPYYKIDASHWITNSAMLVPATNILNDLYSIPMTIVGVMKGVIKCSAKLSSIQITAAPADPALPPLQSECQYTEKTDYSGQVVRTPVCPISNQTGIGANGCPAQCKAGEVLCGVNVDVCGCVGRYRCTTFDVCTTTYKGTVITTPIAGCGSTRSQATGTNWQEMLQNFLDGSNGVSFSQIQGMMQQYLHR